MGGQKTIILEPADCGEKCDDVRNLFKDEIAEGTVFVTSVESKEGKKLAKALGLTKITEPKAVTVSDVATTEEIEEAMKEPEGEEGAGDGTEQG